MLTRNLFRMKFVKHRRRAMSLAEVLVSMGIMTIGLLGVAALFPVGGRYMQSGDIADNANAIAQAALDDAIIRGHLDPENWVVHEPLWGNDNRFSYLLSGDHRNGSMYGLRRFLSQYNVPGSTVRVIASNLYGVNARCAAYGDAFIIDPLGIATTLEDTSLGNRLYTSLLNSMPLRHFPALERFTPSATAAWAPWHTVGATWPVRRVTSVHDPFNLNSSEDFHYGLPKAIESFSATDDLAASLPTDGDSPSLQLLETYQQNGNQVAAKRQSKGDYSWIISVSPGSSEARDALATQPDAYQYDVSVVVFNKRFLGQGFEGTLEAERLVNARVVTTGIAGGELLLEKRDSEDNAPYTDFESPFENLREGEYIMLAGPHPLSTDNRPMLFMQWYKVQSIEDSGEQTINGEVIQLNRENTVLVSLRGPDWPWQPTDNSNFGNTSLLPNDLRVGIIPGAVAVHTKTMRLESGSDWGR